MRVQGCENATVGTPRLESEEPRAMPNVNSYQIGDSWEGLLRPAFIAHLRPSNSCRLAGYDSFQ